MLTKVIEPTFVRLATKKTIKDHKISLNKSNRKIGNSSRMPPTIINQAPVENFRPMRVIVIGAGFSGIYCGVRIPERLRNVELCIYEKNAGVGGTWFENR